MVALLQGTDGEHRHSESKMKVKVTPMISYTTERLLLRRGDNSRDNRPFLHMLKADGDFRAFSGAELTDRSLANFENYFEHPCSCYYAIFLKNDVHSEMIGYAGFSLQRGRIEAEFYMSRHYRGQGYCTEAMKKLLDEVFAGNLWWRDESGEDALLSVQTIYGTTISSNVPAVRVLEKCGFIKNPDVVLCFQLLIDPETDDTYENAIAEYVLVSTESPAP